MTTYYSEQAEEYRKLSRRAYYDARKFKRNAVKYEEYAKMHDRLAAYFDRDDDILSAASERGIATSMRRLVVQALVHVPKEYERARKYSGIARRYQHRADTGEWE